MIGLKNRARRNSAAAAEGGQAGPPALLHARGALDEAGDGAGAQGGAGHGADGVGHQGLPGPRQAVVADQARLLGHADQRAQRVEQHHEQEDQDEREHRQADSAPTRSSFHSVGAIGGGADDDLMGERELRQQHRVSSPAARPSPTRPR